MTKKAVNVENKTVTFDFENEKTSVFDLSKVSPEMVIQLALHGASQKCGDSYASAKKASEELKVDPAEWSQEQVDSVIAQLVAGEWTVRTPGIGGSVTDLATALSEAVGCTVEEAVAKLAETDKEQKKELRAHPDIKAVLERLKLERQKAKAEKASKAAGTGTDLTAFMVG